MKYKPLNYTPTQLLHKVGFIDSPNGMGYQLTIGSPKNTDIILANRMHAYVVEDTIDFHHDKKAKGKRHIASSFDLRCRGLKEIFMFFDGQIEKIHPKNRFRKKYAEIIKNNK